MKLTALVSLFLLGLVAGLQAQTTQGTFALGLHNFSPTLSEATLLAPTNSLGISFSKSKSEIDGRESDGEVSITNLGLNASVHYFFVNNFSGGLNLSVFNQSAKFDDGSGDDDKEKLTLFMAGPELRYYFNTGAKTKVYLRGGASFGSAKAEFDGEEEDDPTKLSQFGGGAALAFFPSSAFSIDFGLGYNVFQTKDEIDFGTGPVDAVDTTSGVTFDIGFSIYLGGGEED